eukprot:561896-Rhodomonas_salina.1
MATAYVRPGPLMANAEDKAERGCVAGALWPPTVEPRTQVHLDRAPSRVPASDRSAVRAGFLDSTKAKEQGDKSKL